jgi:osmotically-inducible protein OsmY
MHRAHAGAAEVGLWLSLALAVPIAAQAPDNTKANKADQLSADTQKNNKNDLAITRDIRRAIIADKNLSTYAHNVKVITEKGEVTLKGPVRSEEERKTIEAKAIEVAGQGRVANELTVAPPKAK